MSQTKIITFLGDRGALKTTYSYESKTYQGGVFAEVLRQFCEYDTMLVCVTEKAKQNTWTVLENFWGGACRPLRNIWVALIFNLT